MDFVPLMDRFGEGGTALLGGAVLGAIFGIAMQRTAFCTRTAVIDLVRGRGLAMPAIWLLAFATAVVIVQTLLAMNMIAVGDSRYFATGQSLSGAAIGGALFGLGMILSRGCVSRLLVLSASGNLRAIYGVVIVALVSFATLYGFLSAPRESVGALMSSAAIGGNAVIDHTGGSNYNGAILAGLIALCAVVLAGFARVGALRFLGAVVIGGAVAGGWYFTATLSAQVFEPIAVDSMSFIRPLAQTTGYLFGAAEQPTFDLGLVGGTLAGALLAALVFGGFRVATFGEAGAPSVVRYTIGSALMGFGGVLAAGCTIGAGLTGGSVLAISALIAISAMAIAAALADIVVDGPVREKLGAAVPSLSR